MCAGGRLGTFTHVRAALLDLFLVMGSQLLRRFVRAVPGPLSPRPRGHLGWMSFKPAEYRARASPPWVTFRMEAMRSRRAFPGRARGPQGWLSL